MSDRVRCVVCGRNGRDYLCAPCRRSYASRFGAFDGHIGVIEWAAARALNRHEAETKRPLSSYQRATYRAGLKLRKGRR